MSPYQPVRYMEWAKSVPPSCSIKLSMSGVDAPPSSLLGEDLSLAQLLGTDPGAYATPLLSAAVASTYGVEESQVVLTGGTSEANFLVLASLLEPGEGVMVETPAYEPLVRVVEALGGHVLPLYRRPESGFSIDFNSLEKGLRAGARAVLVTHLHNPSGVPLAEAELHRMVEMARTHGATVVVDEVYREFIPGETYPVAATLGESVVTTGSLTKVYGLGMLRMGWILAPAPLARRCHEVRDHLEVVLPSPTVALSLRAFSSLDRLRQRSLGVAATGRSVMEEFVAGHPQWEFSHPAGGLCGVLRLPRGLDDHAVSQRMRKEHGVAVVPGSFFGLPGWLRVGWGEEEGRLRKGLETLEGVIGEG